MPLDHPAMPPMSVEAGMFSAEFSCSQSTLVRSFSVSTSVVLTLPEFRHWIRLPRFRPAMPPT